MDPEFKLVACDKASKYYKKVARRRERQDTNSVIENLYHLVYHMN